MSNLPQNSQSGLQNPSISHCLSDCISQYSPLFLLVLPHQPPCCCGMYQAYFLLRAFLLALLSYGMCFLLMFARLTPSSASSLCPVTTFSLRKCPTSTYSSNSPHPQHLPCANVPCQVSVVSRPVGEYKLHQGRYFCLLLHWYIPSAQNSVWHIVCLQLIF